MKNWADILLADQLVIRGNLAPANVGILPNPLYGSLRLYCLSRVESFIGEVEYIRGPEGSSLHQREYGWTSGLEQGFREIEAIWDPACREFWRLCEQSYVCEGISHRGRQIRPADPRMIFHLGVVTRLLEENVRKLWVSRPMVDKLAGFTHDQLRAYDKIFPIRT